MGGDDDEYPAVNWEVADIIKTCAICSTTFSEMNNIGRWMCRMHPGTLENGRFQCCGQRTTANTIGQFIRQTSQPQLLGCRVCDHRADLDFFISGPFIQFPARFWPMLGSRKDSIVAVRRPAAIGMDRTVVCSRVETDAAYEKRTVKK